MNTPLINVDILHNVAQFADFSTVLQLTKTCREFNAECAQYLLKNDGVYLEGEESVESFIVFLTASGRDDYARRRLPFCTDIELSVGPSPSQNIKFALAVLFARIRSEAPWFRFLALHHSDALLAPDSPLPEVVAALATLEELNLYEYGAHCAAVLPFMQSRLLTATLAHDESTHYPLEDPLFLLRRSQKTLKCMDVTLPIILRQEFCYSNLVELRISRPNLLPSTWTYICAFPRLVGLAVGFGAHFARECASIVSACRQWNIAEQKRLGTWTSLRRVQGALADLFLLGLTCAVPELAIDDLSDGLSESDARTPDLRRRQADAWRQVLGYARPSRVTLQIDDSDWIVDNHGFALLSETPELVSLQSLHLTVGVSYAMGSNWDTLGVHDALDVLWVIVKSFIKPVEVSVTFDWTGWSAVAREFVASHPQCAGSDMDFPREELDAVDMDGHVRRFLHKDTRSVRYCHVGPDGWRREATYSRVSDEEHAAIIEAVDQMEMDVD
ncbi:hypothetical protein GSI_15596 [Ganoderma sinense ZZ0214-1]|uniref:F-box domain-containing protein n=1 Tax=Ganoderma sinense ZZ0214-1 TaxID=1077348 RepID=A0A2G8RN16_9APHY|nr:hypothetical protein GSI_15596 [Ganoderma sinense ZZ0214-1]